MAKSLRDIIAKDNKSAGRNIPKGEADFLDAHKVEVTDYPVKQVKKDITHKAVDVKPEDESQKDAGKRHGYRKNQDVEAYADTNEEVEQVDEVSSALIKRAAIASAKKDMSNWAQIGHSDRTKRLSKAYTKKADDERKAAGQGFSSSVKKEEVEPVEEMKRSEAERRGAARDDVRRMSSGEMKKREDIVKGMKKNLSSFKQRYGERAKNVMYATATKMAQK